MSHSRSNHSDIFINYDHQLNEIIDPRIQADAQRIAKRISAKPGSRPSNGFMAFKHHRSEDPQSRDPLKAGEDWNNLSASEKQKWDSVYEASKRSHPRTQSKNARESASPSAHRSKRPQSCTFCQTRSRPPPSRNLIARHSQADRSSHRLDNHSGAASRLKFLAIALPHASYAGNVPFILGSLGFLQRCICF
ncbi:hypothetical protein BDP27DRAFT_1318759 [Rhodocollybia butyracea]|uniref:HMG box domain-containing protein n=1 Tax=Rhodocollybia butyracea TaxID=206335 RepID=A0A9P5Q3A4_9AGAR|nr:hypothetical protein BDP27DRAFT_1318759 [Rhodocollybia butyracea]